MLKCLWRMSSTQQSVIKNQDLPNDYFNQGFNSYALLSINLNQKIITNIDFNPNYFKSYAYD